MNPMKKRPKLKKLNIPPETVALRLREMSGLHKLGMSMEGAKWKGKVIELVEEDARQKQESGSDPK